MNNAMSIPAAGMLAFTLVGMAAACGDGNAGAEQPLSPSPSAALGSISVTVSTTGVGLDTDGYTVTVDGFEIHSLPTNGTLIFSDLPAGDHSIELGGAAPNCPIVDDNTQLVTVTPGGTTQVVFNVVCAGVIVDSVLSARVPLGSN